MSHLCSLTWFLFMFYQLGFWWIWKVTYSCHVSHRIHDVSYIVHLSIFLLRRLGHNEQKDEWQPRLVEIFQKSNILGPNDIISAGSASSACTAGGMMHICLMHMLFYHATLG